MAGAVGQLVKDLCSMQEALSSVPNTTKNPNAVVRTCNPIAGEVETGSSGIQGHSCWLHN